MCISRHDYEPLFNAAVETESDGSCSGPRPTGTEWAMGTCAEVLNGGGSFGSFISRSFADCAPPIIVGEPGCLHLPDHGLYYDIEFHSWTEGGNGGGFSYTRTLLPCGIPNATCSEEGGRVSCTCTEVAAGFLTSGVCPSHQGWLASDRAAETTSLQLTHAKKATRARRRPVFVFRSSRGRT